MDLKYFTGPITKADGGGLEAIISTPRVDHDGESVDPMGLRNRDEWLTNPLIYWAHEWARNPMAEPIGKGTRLDVHGDRIESAAVYAPTPKAQNIRALVAGGFVRKTSIGFDPLEMAEVKGIPTHTAWNLLEWSVVPMPANTEATITGVKSALRWLADEVAEPVDPWTDTPSDPPAIIKDGDTYYMAYNAGSDIHIASAPTMTGPWAKYGSNPVLRGGGVSVSLSAEAIEALVTKTVDARLDLFAVPDGAITLAENGKRIATIRRRRVLHL